MDKNTVLSFSTDRNSLVQRECALRNGGFEVISVESEIQARFEIEMGRCGVLLICFRASAATTQELTSLFRQSCPNGIIIFVMRPSYEVPTKVDYIVPESDEPEAIVQALRSDPQLESRAR
jgi:hypothetical protein